VALGSADHHLPRGRLSRAAHPRSAAGRLGWGIATGFAVAILAGVACPDFGGALRIVAGWDAGGVAILGLAWWLILTANASEMRRRASTVDPGRRVVGATVLLGNVFSLFAAVVLLRRAEHLAPTRVALLSGLCLVAVVIAWFLTHTAYTLRYAHLYYRDDEEGIGGLEFPGKEPPDALDFAYFAFTLGMCFQVSDVPVTSRQIRRAALGHALLSFAFNTAIVALALNLVFNLLN
jgi:uncharacterized membrane protein